MALISCCKSPLRVSRRVAGFGTILAKAMAVHRREIGSRAEDSIPDRARWLQGICRDILAMMNVPVRTSGTVPHNGLLVANHLSYLDILVICSVTPTVFISKADVRNWPVFGKFAALSGTLFVKREKRGDVSRMSDQMKAVLDAGVLLALFPEGTSSGGETVLPFKSSLLEPVVQHNHPVAAAAIDYHLPDGSVPDEICYWRDMTLVPHLLNMFAKENIQAFVSYSPTRQRHGDRKQMAKELHAEVLALKTGLGLRAA